MSGLFTAAFLRQIGWVCDVYERSTVDWPAAAPASQHIQSFWKRYKRAALAPVTLASRSVLKLFTLRIESFRIREQPAAWWADHRV